MGRKRIEINPLCGKRLNEWLSLCKMSQNELSRQTGYSQQQISEVINGKKSLTIGFAEVIRDTVKCDYYDNGQESTVRIEWLLCFDDYMTEGIRMSAILDNKDFMFRLIESSLKRQNLSMHRDNKQYNIIDTTGNVIKKLTHDDLYKSFISKITDYADLLTFNIVNKI